MSAAVSAALPWIVCGLAAAILIPGVVDFLRGKGREEYKKEDGTDKKNDLNSWMIEGVAVGMLAGYWLGRVLGNAVLGLALGVLIGMFAGSKIKKFK